MKNERGFIQIILVVVGALVLLKYIYDIDVVGFLTQGWFKGFLDKIYEFGTKGWQKYSSVVFGVWGYIIDLVKNIIDKIK